MRSEICFVPFYHSVVILMIFFPKRYAIVNVNSEQIRLNLSNCIVLLLLLLLLLLL